MEDNLTLDELVATHKALVRAEHDRTKMIFASQGHDFPDFEDGTKSEKTVEDVYRAAMYGSKFGEWDPDKDYKLEEISELIGLGMEVE